MTATILLVIDGLRPDALTATPTPHIHGLMKGGSSALSMDTVIPPITQPCHFSLFTGRKPLAHNVLTNTGRPDISPDCPGLFELAHYCGLKTAMFYSWEHLRNLSPPGLLDYSFLINTISLHPADMDEKIMDIALPCFFSVFPDFCFIYLEGVDAAGHEHGWMSTKYLEAVTKADRAVGRLMKRLMESERDKQYNILLLADHGGLHTHHIEPVPEVMTIPFIAWGPDIKKDYKIDRQTSILDISPTVTDFLDLPQKCQWDGKSISEIFV